MFRDCELSCEWRTIAECRKLAFLPASFGLATLMPDRHARLTDDLFAQRERYLGGVRAVQHCAVTGGYLPFCLRLHLGESEVPRQRH